MHLNTADRVLNWIAGLAVVALIAIILFIGANSDKNTTSNTPSADTGSTYAPDEIAKQHNRQRAELLVAGEVTRAPQIKRDPSWFRGNGR
jgi:hypothetical protein